MAKTIDKKKLVNRWFTGIFYEEDPNYKKYIKNIIDHSEEWASIDHDRDIDEDGNIKKTHTHIIWKVGENARHRKSVAKDIECNENMIEGCNKDKMLLYLIHKNNPEKTQYQASAVQGTLKEYLYKLCIRQIDTAPKLREVIEKITQEDITDMRKATLMIIDMGYIDILNKYQYIIKTIVYENRI